MNLVNQKDALAILDVCAQHKQHSLLISGPSGCGKSWLARQYCKMLGIEDFQIIEPKVASVRDIIDVVTLLGTPIVLCIENLDDGVAGAAYTLLKFLEEPPSHVYIVVTCRNLRSVPDTIISRTVSVSVPEINKDDLIKYIAETEATVISKNSQLMNCVHSFNDVDTLKSMSESNIGYFLDLPNTIRSADTVSSALWKVQHFPDNSDIPVVLAVRFLMKAHQNWVLPCLEALDALELSNIPNHVVLAKLIFQLRYVYL